MRHVSIRNWDRYQHYRHRNPPWVKLHVKMLADYKFLRLSDTGKLHLLASIMLAAQYDNEIPADPKFLQQILCLSEPFLIDDLVSAGFLEYVENNAATQPVTGNASNTLATRKHNASKVHQNATTETETETETEKKKGAKANRFRPPSLSEVTAYCTERRSRIDAGAFHAYYESNGWHVGKSKMRDWKAAVTTWEKRNAADRKTGSNRRNGSHATLERIAAEDDPEELGSAPVSEVHDGIRPAVDGEYRRH